MNYRIASSKKVDADAVFLKRSNTVAYKKLCVLIDELKHAPYSGTGHPEALRHRPGCYSRRIDKKNRLVYQIDETNSTVYVLSVMGHYDD